MFNDTSLCGAGKDAKAYSSANSKRQSCKEKITPAYSSANSKMQSCKEEVTAVLSHATYTAQSKTNKVQDTKQEEVQEEEMTCSFAMQALKIGTEVCKHGCTVVQEQQLDDGYMLCSFSQLAIQDATSARLVL